MRKMAESHVPPPAVAAAAARGLALRQSASPSNKGGLTVSQAHQQGIGSGVQRAVDLKNRRALSPDTVRRMHAFFSRHQKNKAVDPGKTPAQDKGHQAWLLWGGDPGRTWARGIVERMDAGVEKKAYRTGSADSVFTRFFTNKTRVAENQAMAPQPPPPKNPAAVPAPPAGGLPSPFGSGRTDRAMAQAGIGMP
jgi:hypothetical protein